METFIIGLTGILVSWLFAWMLWALAEQETRRFFSGLADSPWADGFQRSFTPLEEFAARLLAGWHLQDAFNSSVGPRAVFNRPKWVSAGGAVVDMLFTLGVVLVLVGSTHALTGVGSFFILWYVGTGCWLFIKDVLGRGQIGRHGYHVRFLVSVSLWPVMMAIQFADGSEIEGGIGHC